MVQRANYNKYGAVALGVDAVDFPTAADYSVV